MQKKNAIKFLSLMLAVVVMASLFAACGQQNSSQQATTASTQNSKSTAKALSPDQPGWKADTSPVTFDWYLNFSWFPNKWGVDATSQYITKKTGVNLNLIVPAGNENEKLNTMIASNSLPDFITLGWYEDGVKKMIEGGLVYPLNKLADQYDPYFYNVANKGRLGWYTKDDGNVYGYPNASFAPDDYTKGNKIYSNETFLVKKDMYEALGKPDMRTPEGFLNALKMAKEKFPQVNGQPLIPLGLQEFGDTGNTSLEVYLQDFLSVPREVNGKYVDPSNGNTYPDYVNWLKTLRKANEMGLLAKDVFIDKRSQMEEKIAQGRYFAMIYQRSDLATQEGALFAKDPNSVYIAVDGPANSKMDPPKLGGGGIAGWTITLISKNCKNPDRAIKFMSYCMSEEGQKDFYLGAPKICWDTINGKDQLLPDVVNLCNSDRASFDKKYGASETFWMLMDNPMFAKWEPDLVEPYKQMADWTLDKTVSYAPYDDLNPPADSPEGTIQTKVNQKWGQVLPKLLLAGSDQDFDKIWNDFQAEKQKLGWDKVQAYQQAKVVDHKKKLGMQ